MNNDECECPICYDTITDQIVMRCNHKVCKDCWDKLQDTQTCCPICRAPFANDNTNNIFHSRPRMAYIATTTFHEYNYHNNQIKPHDIVAILILLTVMLFVSMFIWVDSSCMCSQFEPGTLTKTSYHFFGGYTVQTRPNFCVQYC